MSEGFDNPYSDPPAPSKGEKQFEYAVQVNMLLDLIGWHFTPTEIEALAKVFGAVWREYKRDD